MRKAKIVRCHEVGIRSSVCNPGDNTIIAIVPADTIIKVDDSLVVFDWRDNQFYRCEVNGMDGYVIKEACELL